MPPKTAAEMVQMLTSAGMMKAYIDLTTAAKKHRLNEGDIAGIEREVLIEIGKARAAIPDFSFDAEAAIREAEAALAQIFNAAKHGRIAPDNAQQDRPKS